MSDTAITCLLLVAFALLWFTASDVRLALAVRDFFRRIFRR